MSAVSDPQRSDAAAAAPTQTTKVAEHHYPGTEVAPSPIVAETLAELRLLFPLFPFVNTTSEPAQVLPYLWLGAAQHAKNIGIASRFTHIINCCEGDEGTAHYTVLKAKGIRCVGFHSEDSANYPLLANHLDEVLAFIRTARQQQGKVLLHCQAGVNRSGALAIAVVVEETGTSLLEACRHVKAARGRVCTNVAFQTQLVQQAIARDWAFKSN